MITHNQVMFKLLPLCTSYIGALIVYSDANFYSRKRLCTYQHCILHNCGRWFVVQLRWL